MASGINQVPARQHVDRAKCRTTGRACMIQTYAGILVCLHVEKRLNAIGFIQYSRVIAGKPSHLGFRENHGCWSDGDDGRRRGILWYNENLHISMTILSKGKNTVAPITPPWKRVRSRPHDHVSVCLDRPITSPRKCMTLTYHSHIIDN